MSSPTRGTPTRGPGLSRDQARDSFRRLMSSLEEQQRQLDSSLHRLSEIPKTDLPEFLSRQHDFFAALQKEQAREWASLIGDENDMTAPSRDKGAAGTPFGVHLRSLEARVTAMGGIPALGAGLVLPRMTPAAKSQLSTTASPAAVDIARARASQGQAEPLRRVEADASAALSSPPDGDVGSRAVPPPALRQGLQASDLQAEFAAAMARRRQAQGD